MNVSVCRNRRSVRAAGGRRTRLLVKLFEDLEDADVVEHGEVAQVVHRAAVFKKLAQLGQVRR